MIGPVAKEANFPNFQEGKQSNISVIIVKAHRGLSAGWSKVLRFRLTPIKKENKIMLDNQTEICYTKGTVREGGVQPIKKYVVGYEREGKFAVLYESDNLRLAMVIAKKYREARKEEIKIKKRA